MTTVPAGRYGDYSTAFIQAYIDAKIAGVLDTAPDTLNTLNELAAAIGDDASFFATMSAANTTLQTNIDNLSTAAASARTSLQTLLQNAVDAVQADVDSNETAAASAVVAEASARGTALTNLQTTLQGLIDAVQADVDANELASDNAEAALSARITTLEADATTATAVAAVQADVDANETASDAAEAALSGRLDVLEADPTTKDYVDTQVAGLINAAPGVLNTLDELAAALNDDANFATTITNSIAAVQTDVDANETASDAAEAALSTRLDTLEADPTTATALTNGLALKADLAGATFTGDVIVDEGDGPTIKLETSQTGNAGIVINGSSGVYAYIDTAAGFANDSLQVYSGLFWVRSINGGDGTAMFDGDVTLQAGLNFSNGLTDAADDTAAASAGVAVGQLYRNGSVVMIRVS